MAIIPRVIQKCLHPSLEQAVETTTQPDVSQQPRVPQSPRLVAGVQEGQPSRFSSSVEERIRVPQRASSRAIYTSRWSLYGKWCKQNKMDVKSSSVPQIADFLCYLFEEKQLKPATIAGYRTAIADHLGSDGSIVSQSRELNRLIASFYRDKPRQDRAIPSWDLSLVLLSLNKQPFEPLREASLRHLTFKTVFLLALVSGKRRSEIHA